eukprot:5058749-Prymnesium_polylepis.1
MALCCEVAGTGMCGTVLCFYAAPGHISFCTPRAFTCVRRLVHVSCPWQVGAIKNISEYPKARKHIDKYVRASGASEQYSNMMDKPMYDHRQWPASFRYEHQNVAPKRSTRELART